MHKHDTPAERCPPWDISACAHKQLSYGAGNKQIKRALQCTQCTRRARLPPAAPCSCARACSTTSITVCVCVCARAQLCCVHLMHIFALYIFRSSHQTKICMCVCGYGMFYIRELVSRSLLPHCNTPAACLPACRVCF